MTSCDHNLTSRANIGRSPFPPEELENGRNRVWAFFRIRAWASNICALKRGSGQPNIVEHREQLSYLR